MPRHYDSAAEADHSNELEASLEDGFNTQRIHVAKVVCSRALLGRTVELQLVKLVVELLQLCIGLYRLLLKTGIVGTGHIDKCMDGEDGPAEVLAGYRMYEGIPEVGRFRVVKTGETKEEKKEARGESIEGTDP